jgi:putative ABC transport system permease protein
MKHKTNQPPALAVRILQWYCRKALIEDLQGDIDELFQQDLEHHSAFKAKLKYWRYTFSLIFSYAVKKRKRQSSLHTFSSNSFDVSMLYNYFIIASRSLAKHRFFTIINVLGLAIGMSVCLLLISLLSFVFTYDDFHVNKDLIYRVISITNDGQNRDDRACSPAPLAEILSNGVTGIQRVVKIQAPFYSEATHGSQHLPLRGYFVDNGFLEMFTFSLLKGKISNALAKPYSVVITEKAAKKMFNLEDPIGKVITMGEAGDFVVTGLLQDHPKNSHMQFEILCSYATLETFAGKKLISTNGWQEFFNSYIYIQFAPNDKLVRKVSQVEDYLAGISNDAYSTSPNFKATFELQALVDIEPGRELHNQIGPEWGGVGLGIFTSLTLLILLPACFNYTNISISRSLRRAKEIGLRKVMGGQRSQIFSQFIIETVVITMIALIGAYGIFLAVRGEFLSLLVETDALELNADPVTLMYFVLFAAIVGFSAGVVPALYFSRMNPVESLKNSTHMRGLGRVGLRKALIVGQFALSLGFIMSVIITLRQHEKSIRYDFGFERDNILTLDLKGMDPNVFRNEFSKLSVVQKTALASNIAGTSVASLSYIVNDDGKDSVEVFDMYADSHYLSTLGIELMAGRTFGDALDGDNGNIIVNEKFVKEFELGRPADAIGKMFTLSTGSVVKVIGVMKDFHYMDLQHPIKGFFLHCDPAQLKFGYIKISAGDQFEIIASLESVWKKLETEQKFEPRYLADLIEEMYSFHFSMVKICGFLGLLAISISCLGLLGMVVFTVENRMKEVGIRKAMGATTGALAYLLSADFFRLMIIAALIATPLTWFFFEKVYLSVQYYSFHVGSLEILCSLSLMLLLGLGTVLSQTLKAARSNPVDTLRYE